MFTVNTLGCLTTAVRNYLHEDLDVQIQPVSGGDIHQSFCVEAKQIEFAKLFVKVNEVRHLAILQGEYNSLQSFEKYPALNYPKPLHFCQDAQYCYLFMPFHEIAPLNAVTSAAAGTMLAVQHQQTNSHYGWCQDNHIGLTPQSNSLSDSWSDFFREQRLRPQVNLARSNGLGERVADQIELLTERLEELLEHQNLRPALLHGDLWSGNIGFDKQRGVPVFYDPAPYYGDPEVDLAMTELFGSFNSNFYSAYRECQKPLKRNEIRKSIYNLYHALNHFNLFGITYQTLVKQQVLEIKNAS